MTTRRGTSRATLGSTRLEATTEQPEGHALREDQEANTSTIDSAKADFSKGQESSDASVAAAATASAAVEPAGGRSSEAGGEEEVGHAPSMAAVTPEVDAAAGLGQTAEEAEIMADLLAQQPGGQDEVEGEETAPTPMVSDDVLGWSFARVGAVRTWPTHQSCTSRLRSCFACSMMG